VATNANPFTTVASTVVVAQAIMVPASLAATRIAGARGYWSVILIALSVAVPGLVARILDGTGHINLGQGAVIAAQGLGGALSPMLGGVAAQSLGFSPAFAILGGLSLGSVAIWLGFASMLRRTGDGVGPGIEDPTDLPLKNHPKNN
jgi:hypothetical protein